MGLEGERSASHPTAGIDCQLIAKEGGGGEGLYTSSSDIIRFAEVVVGSVSFDI